MALSERENSSPLDLIVLGASGQVGRALLTAAPHLGYRRATGLSRAQADLSRPDEIIAALERLVPPGSLPAIINAAAYTQVDRAEKEPETAELINGVAPGRLARWAAKRGIPFIHYSTDYVFPGTVDRPWNEDDRTDPLNVYGKTKLHGEQGIQEAGGKYLIFRTSWVYDASGANFLNTMLRLGSEKETLSVVNDQIGAPSFAPDLAQATLRALASAEESAARSGTFPSGIYHLTNSGETSWHGFAEAIFSEARELGMPLKIRDLRAIPSAGYPTPAPRPKNSRLSNDRFAKQFGFGLRPWREALHECMREKCGK